MASRFNIPTPLGTPVRVYRNLHPTKPTWSIQAKVRQPGTNRHHWKVVGWSDDLVLRDATFTVYEAGRRRVLASGVKNVHAYVLGILAKVGHPLADGLGVFDQPVRYVPTVAPHFHAPDAPATPVRYAEGAVLTEHGKVWTRNRKPPIV